MRAAPRVTSLLGRKIQTCLGAEPAGRANPRAKHFRDAAVPLDSFPVRPLDVELTSGEPRGVLLALGAEIFNFQFFERRHDISDGQRPPDSGLLPLCIAFSAAGNNAAAPVSGLRGSRCALVPARIPRGPRLAGVSLALPVPLDPAFRAAPAAAIAAPALGADNKRYLA